MEIDIAANLQNVRANIEAARAKSTLAAKDVLLVAVSKTKPLSMVQEALQAGQITFGENRVQELVEKQQALPQVNWHLIGHLQTNKVKYLFDENGLRVKLIHSLDRMELAAELQKRAERANLQVPVLVQVNIADEESKFGLHEAETIDFLAAMANFPNRKIGGLMTIGPLVENSEDARPVFRALRLLSEKVAAKGFQHLEMRYLSMGMSNDYAVAIEEGANIVRVGSSIFGHR